MTPPPIPPPLIEAGARALRELHPRHQLFAEGAAEAVLRAIGLPELIGAAEDVVSARDHGWKTTQEIDRLAAILSKLKAPDNA